MSSNLGCMGFVACRWAKKCLLETPVFETRQCFFENFSVAVLAKVFVNVVVMKKKTENQAFLAVHCVAVKDSKNFGFPVLEDFSCM